MGHRSVGLNNDMSGRVEVAELDWRKVEKGQGLPRGPFDLILGSDIVLWPELFQPLLGTLLRLAPNHWISVLLSVQHRGHSVKEFLTMLKEHFEVETVKSEFSEVFQGAGYAVEIYRLKRYRQ